MSAARRVAGIHSVHTALRHGADNLLGVWFDRSRRDRRLGRLLTELRRAGVALHPADREYLDALADGANHQGVVAEVRGPAARGGEELDALLEAIQGPPFLLLLDGVQDPHNLGACLRTAEAAGVQAVIAPRDRSAGLTPVACKVASGAAETLPFLQVTNLARTLAGLRDRGIWVVGGAGEAGTSLYAADLRGPLALVMGGEGKGMRRLTREACDLLVHIPMAGSVESLNVSVATGVCLFEAVRQRSLGA